jgi:hypothetical protein
MERLYRSTLPTGQQAESLLRKGKANAVIHEPRGLLRNAESVRGLRRN